MQKRLKPIYAQSRQVAQHARQFQPASLGDSLPRAMNFPQNKGASFANLGPDEEGWATDGLDVEAQIAAHAYDPEAEPESQVGADRAAEGDGEHFQGPGHGA